MVLTQECVAHFHGFVHFIPFLARGHACSKRNSEAGLARFLWILARCKSVKRNTSEESCSSSPSQTLGKSSGNVTKEKVRESIIRSLVNWLATSGLRKILFFLASPGKRKRKKSSEERSPMKRDKEEVAQQSNWEILIALWLGEHIQLSVNLTRAQRGDTLVTRCGLGRAQESTGEHRRGHE